MEKLKTLIESLAALKKEAGRIIGYGSEYEIHLVDAWIGYRFYTEGDTLSILDDEDEEYQYTISSYAAKSEQFFQGTEDGWTFIMGYSDEEMTSDARVIILKEENRIKN